MVLVTQGPIEFLSDSGPAHEVPSTEFGGADGLIQPTNDVTLSGDPEASGGHTLEGGTREEQGEVAGIMARRALAPVDVVNGVVLGDVDGTLSQADPVDPVTGRVAPPTINKASAGGVGRTGNAGELSDLAPY